MSAKNDFFQFFEHHNVNWWFADAQIRKSNGERGAPVGKIFKFEHAFHVTKIGSALDRLAEKIHSRGRASQGFDCVTRESPDRRAGARTLLVDDLDDANIDLLLTWWTGPMALIETSAMNFQALLITQDGLQPSEQLLALRALARKFGADEGAAQPCQLHRFPGSLNNKRAAVVEGNPFTTRLIKLIGGEGNGVEQVQELLSVQDLANKSESKRIGARKPPSIEPNDADNSSLAFRRTLVMVQSGCSDEVILDELRSPRWLKHHGPNDWPQRTLHNAKFFCKLVSNRYSSAKRRV